MVTFVGAVSGSVLILLSLLHFHWALGGSYGFDKSLPTNKEGERVLNPKKVDSTIVGAGLMFFAILYLTKTGIFSFPIPEIIMSYGVWFIVVIFSLRSIGDFKYVGLFKKVKGTDFSKMDTKLYVPLCLFLATSGLIIEFFG